MLGVSTETRTLPTSTRLQEYSPLGWIMAVSTLPLAKWNVTVPEGKGLLLNVTWPVIAPYLGPQPGRQTNINSKEETRTRRIAARIVRFLVLGVRFRRFFGEGAASAETLGWEPTGAGRGRAPPPLS